MSIINEALKKAAQNRMLLDHKTRQIPSRSVYLLSFLLLLGLLIIWVATNRGKQNVDIAPPPKTESYRKEATFYQREAEIEPSGQVNFRLSGILYDEKKPLAIINGRVVEEGAFIQEAQLLEIQPRFVRLSFKGEEFILKVK